MLHPVRSFWENKTIFIVVLMFLCIFSAWGESFINVDTGLFVNRASVFNAAGHDKVDITSGGIQLTYYKGEKIFGAFAQGTFLIPTEESITLVGSAGPDRTSIGLVPGNGGFDFMIGPAFSYSIGPFQFMAGLGGHFNILFNGFDFFWSVGVGTTGCILAKIMPFLSFNVGFNLAIDFFGDITYKSFDHIFFQGYMAGFSTGIGFHF